MSFAALIMDVIRGLNYTTVCKVCKCIFIFIYTTGLIGGYFYLFVFSALNFFELKFMQYIAQASPSLNYSTSHWKDSVNQPCCT